ncbi:MAG: 3-(cis-5,6-dihydroxycyclohexa-1,3-dien-1-yl)propanoate dehydrogenase [Gammaproteobacteria bacterium]
MNWAEQQVVLITGGASGLGRAIARRFRQEGASIGILDRSAAAIADFTAEFGASAVTVAGDVRDLETHRRAVAAMVERFGRLDTFIGNAGIWDFGVSLVDLPDDKIDAAFDEVFGVNVRGCLLGAKAAAPALVRSSGSMIFTVSNAGFYTAGGGPLYTASKHALVGLIRQLAYELAPHVRVNGVAPGAIPTELRGPASLGLAESRLSSLPVAEIVERSLPIPALVQPDGYTAHYVLLASRENARNTTGTIINCDGGFNVRGLLSPSGGTELMKRFETP